MKNGWKFSSIDFPRQWLKEVVTQCRTVGGLLHLLRNEGGLHPRFTDDDASDDIPLEAFIRIEVGKAMLQDQPKFMKQWQLLGERIYSFSNFALQMQILNAAGFGNPAEQRKSR